MKKFFIAIGIFLLICTLAYAKATREGGDETGRIRKLITVFNDVWEDDNNALRVRISIDPASVLSVDTVVPTYFITGQLTIDIVNVGTAQVLSADTTAVTEIIIKPLPTNTGRVFIGSSVTANASMGFIPTSHDNLILRVDSTADVYMDADTGGEGISWVGIVR